MKRTGDTKLKVLLVGDYPPPLGGIAVHVQQLHDFLRRVGVDAKVLDIGKGGRPVPDVVPVRTPRSLSLQLARHVRAGYLVHLHTSGNNATSWTVAAGVGAMTRAMGGRSIITLHSGLLPGFLAESFTRRVLARTALVSFNELVAVSAAVKSGLLEAGVSEERVEVHPAFLASEVHPGSVPEQFEAGRKQFTTLLSYAHHPSLVYGRALMFSALQRLAYRGLDVGLAAFGPGVDSSAFTEDARTLGVEHRIVRLGELPHDACLAVIRDSDVFVRPTTADGDAISIREALSLGVRCVASDVSVRPEGVRIFRGGDVEGLVKAVGDALAHAPEHGVAPDAGGWLWPKYQRLARNGAAFQGSTPTAIAGSSG